MKAPSILLALALLAPPAIHAQTQLPSYLVAQWLEGGVRFCRYSNGTVLNMGINLCPLQI